MIVKLVKIEWVFFCFFGVVFHLLQFVPAATDRYFHVGISSNTGRAPKK
jgi:hypothetical protein